MVVIFLALDLRHRRLAGAHRLAVEMHRAGAAQADAAAEFGAGQLEMLANHPQKRRVAIGVDLAPVCH